MRYLASPIPFELPRTHEEVVSVVGVSLILSSSVPFFFEPNFTARVAPLAAALRIQAQASSNRGKGEDGGCVDTNAYPPIVYGEFLKSKVSGNFSEEATARSGKVGRYWGHVGTVVADMWQRCMLVVGLSRNRHIEDL